MSAADRLITVKAKHLYEFMSANAALVPWSRLSKHHRDWYRNLVREVLAAGPGATENPDNSANADAGH